MIDIGPDEFKDSGLLPIHLALKTNMSPEFCKLLIDACPESVRIRTGLGKLAMHIACGYYLSDWMNIDVLHPQWIDGQSTLVKYLFQMYPENIHALDGENCLPKDHVHKPLITGDDGVFDSALQHENVISIEGMIAFLDRQTLYALKAQDLIMMNTLDTNGWLPLHQALRDNASLGAIKMLVNGNTTALRVINKNYSSPLHIACEFSSADVVQFLLERDDTLLDHCDSKKNSTLHYACRGGNCGAVKYLLERHVSSASERNGNGDLPFHLLCNTGEDKVDRESLEYVDTIWRLLLAFPITVHSFD
jgi:hypothetical protein